MPTIFDGNSADEEREDKPARRKSPETNDHTSTRGSDIQSFPQDLEVVSSYYSDRPTQKTRPVETYSQVMKLERPSKNPLDSFAAKPNVFFDSQDHDEQVILMLRRHPATQVGWVLIALFLAIFPLVITIIPIPSILPASYGFFLSIGWYMLIIGFILESFLTWFFNVYIITDERVIDVDFHSLIYKNITAAKIDNIEDVTAVTGGAIRSVFDFGTVKIQTAGSQAEIEFEDVPHPSKVTRLLNELLLEEEREKIEGRVN